MNISIIKAIILGIIQGLTEFLPVSSSGHLVLVQNIFGLEGDMLLFDTMLHVGTLLSILVVFWKDIAYMFKHPFSKLPIYIITATIPTVIIALLLKDKVEAAFASASTLGFGFIATGLLLLFVELTQSGHKTLKNMQIKDALLIGTMQGIAIFPAISRSGSTISGALLGKLDRKFAAKFSFLMSIPAILGSVVLQAKDLNEAVTAASVTPAIAGMIAAFISGLIAIKAMIEIITNKSLKGFSYYLFTLGGLVLLDQFVFHIFL
ncbi:MAG: undecaprenyl-diphosphate phosphatase [Xylanivirga thermophila]|jgi:undecaprenyl-diphosphatase|uniref:undecaprenyl-diphosphate phosphatase n=1 Tax=Xylanivirga thermophila TaxID=2496273 RepID=UPI001FB5599E|nr:undecaprenyl-diphosphate phosphatase [Xylanivirga thermophila]